MLNAHTHASQYAAENMTLHFACLGYDSQTQAVVRDLYERRDLGVFTGTFVGAVPLHSVLALSVKPLRPPSSDTLWRPWLANCLMQTAFTSAAFPVQRVWEGQESHALDPPQQPPQSPTRQAARAPPRGYSPDPTGLGERDSVSLWIPLAAVSLLLNIVLGSRYLAPRIAAWARPPPRRAGGQVHIGGAVVTVAGAAGGGAWQAR